MRHAAANDQTMASVTSPGIQTIIGLQQGLQRIYDLPELPPVTEFLLHDRALADHLTPPGQRRGDERLLLSEADGELAISLFLAPAVVQALTENDPACSISEVNLQPLVHAIEGVSHWLSVYWHALHRTGVSALELELQAEIDKYALISELLQHQRGSVPRSLHPTLFNPSNLDGRLTTTEWDRYETANRLAAALWKRLLQECGSHPQHPLRLRTLRRFYRLDREGKRRMSGS